MRALLTCQLPTPRSAPPPRACARAPGVGRVQRKALARHHVREPRVSQVGLEGGGGQRAVVLGLVVIAARALALPPLRCACGRSGVQGPFARAAAAPPQQAHQEQTRHWRVVRAKGACIQLHWSGASHCARRGLGPRSQAAHLGLLAALLATRSRSVRTLLRGPPQRAGPAAVRVHTCACCSTAWGAGLRWPWACPTSRALHCARITQTSHAAPPATQMHPCSPT